MKIGIIAAMAAEIACYHQTISQVTSKTIGPVSLYQGQYAGHEIYFVESGIGKVNASIATTCLALEDLDLIINTGSAGAVADQLKVGDLVLASQAAYHDVDATAFGYAKGQVPQMPASYPMYQNERLAQSIDRLSQTNLYQGMIVSSDSFVASQAEISRIQREFPAALCTEMEGAAIAQTCYQFEIPCLIIRAISDTAAQDADVLFDEFIDQAGRDSAQLTLKLIEEGI
ncbi:hypothetical protein AWM75_06630 [Aerococcus urinaehominis]|uniref:adenosylhomocysteine nucleosidase n=1 Tax=Aerococcus urinaehominis TaxID=128944 RepID=A0A0X8FLT7_9LACT|nr:5'-methylthioadenosine/adenosylhomocysteine nucleosidase [Aerococcus urinaehominis]AMB99676.1 hypothetical protein AWM75_06630 [Aerococcus urinaehominis]SDL89981.1 adenosylhomocysteine nucleosidase [Aerococcus urinaehominis]